MKLTLNRTEFMQELQTVQRAISTKTTIPILTGVKLSLSEKGLTMTGSNADISIETFLSVENEKAQMQNRSNRFTSTFLQRNRSSFA